MPLDAPSNSSGKLIKSFFVIVTCYLLFVMALAVVCGFAFPTAFEAMGKDPEVFKELLANKADQLFPRPRFLPTIVAMSLLSVAIGWLVVKLSSFARFSHAIFLIAVVVVTLFQMAFSAIPELQWLFIVLVGACPVGLMVGAKTAMPVAELHETDEPADLQG